MIYRVEFELSEPIEREEMSQTGVATGKMPKKKTHRGIIEQSTAKPIMIGYTVARVGWSIAESKIQNNMALRGDKLAARMFQEKANKVKSLVGSAFSFGMGVAIKGTIGGLFIAMEAMKIASQAISISMENRQLIELNKQEKYLNTHEQQRFVRNMTTESIRW